jgi:hypothetical protein
MKPATIQSPWFARLFLPFIAAVLIDGLSEALKGIGNYIDSLILYHRLLEKTDWNGAFMLLMISVVLAVALYFALLRFAKYESESLAVRTVFLVLALLLVGSSHLWPVILDRSLMHDMYNELTPEKTNLHYIDGRFPSVWNKGITFHGDNSTDLCTNTCSFMFSYPVPELFGEGEMTLKFGADKTILQKCWFDDCQPPKK